ncbi:hypothetical protein [Shinella zoogloeoides]|uniref:hypothetical protein n=1 Tax=Shinella zoogloeoides TaxID=352475 RepID=UPI00299D4E9B|nr:hypothetical protein [Shinella zoogloeoides]
MNFLLEAGLPELEQVLDLPGFFQVPKNAASAVDANDAKTCDGAAVWRKRGQPICRAISQRAASHLNDTTKTRSSPEK